MTSLPSQHLVHFYVRFILQIMTIISTIELLKLSATMAARFDPRVAEPLPEIP